MTRAYHAPCRFSVVHSTPNCSGDLVVPRHRRFRLGEGRRGYHEGDQDIPNAFGERPVLKLMYAAVIRAAERWRGSRSANSSSANSGRFVTSSAVLTLSAWRRPSIPDTRRRSENCELTDERHGTRRHIWLQIDDLGVGRYLTIPKIFPIR